MTYCNKNMCNNTNHCHIKIKVPDICYYMPSSERKFATQSITTNDSVIMLYYFDNGIKKIMHLTYDSINALQTLISEKDINYINKFGLKQ